MKKTCMNDLLKKSVFDSIFFLIHFLIILKLVVETPSLTHNDNEQ